MKKLYGFILLAIALAFPTIANADNEIKIVVNGEYIESDSSSFIEDGRTMVPIRFITEALGYDVSWDEEHFQVTIEDEEHVLTFHIGDSVYILDGAEYEMDIAPTLVYSRTFLPIRFIAEAFNVKVDWDEKYWTVIIGDGYISPSEINDFQEAVIINVNDVNNMTVRIDGIERTVHPIGIQVVHSKTPDLQLFNPSIVFARKFLEGRTVYLETDYMEEDHAGNLFRYIWTKRPAKSVITIEEAKESMFNLIMLRENLAYIANMYNNTRYEDLFRSEFLNAQKSKAL